MHRLIRLFGTSIGRKLVVAVTGAMLLGFLFAHMLGNMALFQGPESLNAYAAWLQGHPLVWAARTGLLGIFGVHVVTTISLALESSAARPTAYTRKEAIAATLSSRYIVVTGLLTLFFVVFHLLHFTFGVVQPEHYRYVDESGRHDVFAMIVYGFQNVWVSTSYIVAMAVLGFHLNHGIASLFQTFGINHESYNTMIRVSARGLVAILVLGNVSIPILVLAGVIQIAH